MKKKIIILETAHGARLANQLWNFISVYAYCLEKGCECRNYCFFEEKKHSSGKITMCDYNQFFNISSGNKIIDFLISLHLGKKFLLWKLYNFYAKLIKKIYFKDMIDSTGENPFYLSPTRCENTENLKNLAEAEKKNFNKLYFKGWLFRNPTGIKKFYPEIKKYFKPRDEIIERINNFTHPLRNNYKEIIGVHIRQSDYKTYAQGKYYFSQAEVMSFLEDYIKVFKKNNDDVLFIICSDGQINNSYFEGINFKISNLKAIEDLFLLSSCDLIIGSNSTFGAFAAYYGDIPIVVFSRPKIKWDYLHNEKKFNYNNECTLVHQ